MVYFQQSRARDSTDDFSFVICLASLSTSHIVSVYDAEIVARVDNQSHGWAQEIRVGEEENR